MKPDTLQHNAKLLKEMGLSSSKIATTATLLNMKPDTLQHNAKLLKEMGLSSSKIAQCASLLGRDPDTLQHNAKLLKEMGLSSSKIATTATLLNMKPDTLQHNAKLLKEMGLSSKQIATNATLLTRDPDTLQWKARWFDAHNMEWRTDVSLLSQSTKRIESALKFLTEECAIPRKYLSTRTITRFKYEYQKKINWDSFSSLSTSEKCSIIRKLRRR